MYLGGGKDELHISGRLLHYFKEGIEGSLREHMHLIYNVYLIGSALGSIHGGVAEISDIVHAVVGSCVYLDYIRQCAAVCVAADVTFKAGIAVLHIAAVYSLCKDTRTGSLTCTAGACEKVGMGSLTADYLVFQSFRSIFLRYYVIKGHGTPFTVQSLIHSLFSFQRKIPEHRCAGLLRHTTRTA